MLKELRQPTKTAALALKDFFLAEDPNEKEYVCEGEPLATWWQQKTPGTSYWRCQLPARHLPGQSLALFYSDLKVDSEGKVLMPRQRGAAIFQFVGNATRALLMAHQQEQGVKALMEVDDNYLVPPPYVPGLRRDWKTQIDRSPADDYSHPAHRKIIQWVDGIIVATDELATRYEKHTSAPISVCPNSIDLADWPALSEGAGRVGNTRHVGYAGSGSHRYDLGLVERALAWAAHQQEVVVYKLGLQEKSWGFPHESLPWTNDLAEYRKNLQVLDIGLCPLKRGEWADCKSDIKAMEYLLSGAVPIVQKAPPYRDWVDVVPSCETEKDWLRAVKWACCASADELYDVWKRGYEFLLSNKLISRHIDKWRDAIR